MDNGYSFLITPVVSGPNAVGSQVTLTLRLQGLFVNGGPIDLTITGANPRTVHLTADGNGVATYSYFGTNAETDTISGIGAGWCCTPTFPSNTVTVNWVANDPVLSSSAVTGRFYTNDGTGVFNIPAGQTPAFTQTFSNINFNPAAGPDNPTTVTNLTRPFTGLTTDSAGAYTGSIAAQGNNLQAGAGTLYNFSAIFTGTLNVPAAGPVTFTFVHDDSFVFSVGGGASRASGVQVGTLPGTSVLQGYAVMGGVNQRSTTGVVTSTVVVNFPAAGTYPYEIDYAKGGDNLLSLRMLANGVPLPAAVQLKLTPNATSSALTGEVKTFVLTAVNPRGVVMANMPATVTIAGPNQQMRSVTTDSVGQASVSYAGSGLALGTDQIQASGRRRPTISWTSMAPGWRGIYLQAESSRFT